jgi:hypothetical protein
MVNLSMRQKFLEGRQIQYTGFKANFEEEWIASFEPKALHFTVFEMNFLESCATEFNQT